MRKSLWLFPAIFILLSIIFLVHYWVVGQAIYGDGIYYYAYVHSLVKDHDIQFRNELGHHYEHANNNAVHEEPLEQVILNKKTHMAPNKYSIGAPLSWISVYIFSDSMNFGLSRWFPQISLAGYNDLNQILLGLENTAFITVGCYIVFVLLKPLFGEKVSVLTILTVLLGSNLFYYGAIDVLNSHPFSFLISSFFLFFWYTTYQKRTRLQWLILGFLLGLIGITRPLDSLYVILPLGEVFTLLPKRKSDYSSWLYQSLINFFLVGSGFAAVFSIQIATWYILYGTFLHNPYSLSGESFNFLQPHLLELFTNTKIGVLWWNPFLLVGFVGSCMFIKRNQAIGRIFIVLILAEYYGIASWSGWTQGESFGIRMLIATYPVFAFGMATILKTLEQRKKTWGMYILVGFLILTNMSLILYFMLFAKSPTYDRGIPTHTKSLEKIEQLLHKF